MAKILIIIHFIAIILKVLRPSTITVTTKKKETKRDRERNIKFNEKDWWMIKPNQ